MTMDVLVDWGMVTLRYIVISNQLEWDSMTIFHITCFDSGLHMVAATFEENGEHGATQLNFVLLFEGLV